MRFLCVVLLVLLILTLFYSCFNKPEINQKIFPLDSLGILFYKDHEFSPVKSDSAIVFSFDEKVVKFNPDEFSIYYNEYQIYVQLLNKNKVAEIDTSGTSCLIHFFLNGKINIATKYPMYYRSVPEGTNYSFHLKKGQKRILNNSVIHLRKMFDNEMVDSIRNIACNDKLEFIFEHEQISFGKNEYSCMPEGNFCTIKLLNKKKLGVIQKQICPIITFCMNGKRYIAKCYTIGAASNPDNCEFAYNISYWRRTIELSEENSLKLRRLSTR